MWRAIVIVGISLLIILFASLNMHATRLNVPFTKGFEIRTVFLLLLCFFLGYASAFFVGLAKVVKNRKRQLGKNEQ